MPPTFLPVRIALGVPRLRTASCFASAGALVSDGYPASSRVGACAGTPRTRAAASRAVRSPGVVLIRRYSSCSGDGGHAPVAIRGWSFDEVRDVVGGRDDGRSGKVVIVDVREPSELRETGIIPGALNMPLQDIESSFTSAEADFREKHEFDRPPRDAHLLFYCKAGVRAVMAARVARDCGWRNVGVYRGSWDEWEALGG